MARIVSVGSALQDVYLIDHDDFGTNRQGFFNQLKLSAKIDIDKIKFSTGGGATNAATTFARSGHESIFMGCIAEDPAGQAILNSLDDEGIDSSYPDWLYVTTFHGDMDSLDQLFTKAKSLGAKIMFNPGKFELEHQRKLLGLLSDVDVLLLNKYEAQKIVKGALLTELIAKLKNYVPNVIITDGHQGAIATDGKEIYRIGIYEDVKIKDSTGAGDAFGSGFLAAYAAGKSFTDSLTFASANSTSVIQHIGSKDGILSQRIKLHPMPIQEVR